MLGEDSTAGEDTIDLLDSEKEGGGTLDSDSVGRMKPQPLTRTANKYRYRKKRLRPDCIIARLTCQAYQVRRIGLLGQAILLLPADRVSAFVIFGW
jgi:hypothetical protein